MRKDLRELYDRLDTMGRDQMAEAFRSVLEAYSETLARTDTLESVQTEMSVQYQKMKRLLQKRFRSGRRRRCRTGSFRRFWIRSSYSI